ncbi:hypothetical protein B0H17DRAFT_1209823 [Mycena rosella]|uniref:C2H2-type domain-containing protein n=1 Tax=Mycena rosella TaxID=1033263 RepID=A0AAD7G953_MYCRO|nr:hypothetical protein B0H17DRAFT_1209823 [Mycena rosella]
MSSSSSAPCSNIVLPSIHEMFPENIACSTGAPPFPCLTVTHFVLAAALPPAHSFSFDVLWSSPHAASLHHIASSRLQPAPAPAPRTVPSLSGSFDGDGNEGGASAGEGKKHVCSACAKCLNRPSSLHIHANTHTCVVIITGQQPAAGLTRSKSFPW